MGFHDSGIDISVCNSSTHSIFRYFHFENFPYCNGTAQKWQMSFLAKFNLESRKNVFFSQSPKYVYLNENCEQNQHPIFSFLLFCCFLFTWFRKLISSTFCTWTKCLFRCLVGYLAGRHKKIDFSCQNSYVWKILRFVPSFVRSLVGWLRANRANCAGCR